MPSNNLYKVLFFLLVGIILVLIYFSHNNLNNAIEGFLNDVKISGDINYDYPIDASDEINKFYSGLLNTGINYENDKLLSLLVKTNKNKENADKLIELRNNLLFTETENGDSYPIGEPVKSIKSKFNSQILSVNNNDINNYNVIVNDKCMTVAGLCPGSFCLQDCQTGIYSSNSQKFVPTRINSSFDAAKIMNTDISQISDTNQYPFNVFRSAVNNKCLTMSNDGLSVQPCNLNNIQQHWQISPNANKCTLA